MTVDPILGIHHVTAIAGDPQANIDFYTGTLGLRLLKITVNFDDPGTYHFYYGDAVGSPGSILTFFPYAGGRKGVRGAGETSRVTLSAPQGAFDYWNSRLTSAAGELSEAHGSLFFADPDGMDIELSFSSDSPGMRWTDSPIPAEHCISKIAGFTLNEAEYEPTAGFLESAMRLIPDQDEQSRFKVGDEFIEIEKSERINHAQVAIGAIHHVAYRVKDDDAQLAWRAHLMDLDIHVSPVMDRVYFRSIYFREPGGVLFELATDPPGFTFDEPLDSLGTKLQLPSWLEPQREKISSILPKIKLPGEAA